MRKLLLSVRIIRKRFIIVIWFFTSQGVKADVLVTLGGGSITGPYHHDFGLGGRLPIVSNDRQHPIQMQPNSSALP